MPKLISFMKSKSKKKKFFGKEKENPGRGFFLF